MPKPYSFFLFIYLFIRSAYALAMSDDDKKCVPNTDRATWKYDKNGESSKVTFDTLFESLSSQGSTGGIRIKNLTEGK